MALTLVTFHAHPDDEAIATGGTMARAKAEGHRVVLVLATRGELGEVAEGVLVPGEDLGTRRGAETLRAAEILGVDRVVFLGYHDSGMAGESTNGHVGAFATADVEEAAERLAHVLRDERADVLTVYDEHGGYGHPDHIQVHRVGHRAAELAATPQVFEATINRDHIVRMMEQSAAQFEALPEEDRPRIDDLDTFGTPEKLLTTIVDIRDFVDLKRAAMAAHASQISEESFFLQMPPDAFAATFGWEWFMRKGALPGAGETSLFEHFS